MLSSGWWQTTNDPVESGEGYFNKDVVLLSEQELRKSVQISHFCFSGQISQLTSPSERFRVEDGPVP